MVTLFPSIISDKRDEISGIYGEDTTDKDTEEPEGEDRD